MHAIILENTEKFSRMQYRVAQAGCDNIIFNESHIPVLQRMENMHNHLKTEISEAQCKLNTLSAIAESFFPPAASFGTPRKSRSIDEDEPQNRTRRLIGAVAALAAGTGFILREPIRKMNAGTLQKLTEPIVAHYTSLHPATAAALDNFVPAKTSFLIAGGSIVLSLFLFILNFPLFHR